MNDTQVLTLLIFLVGIPTLIFGILSRDFLIVGLYIALLSICGYVIVRSMFIRPKRKEMVLRTNSIKEMCDVVGCEEKYLHTVIAKNKVKYHICHQHWYRLDKRVFSPILICYECKKDFVFNWDDYSRIFMVMDNRDSQFANRQQPVFVCRKDFKVSKHSGHTSVTQGHIVFNINKVKLPKGDNRTGGGI